MLNSMTAFAKEDMQSPIGTLSWEMRSINHRYLDLNFRLPEILTSIEPQLREIARQKCQRGRIDFILRYQLTSSTDAMNIDIKFADKLLQNVELLSANRKLAVTCNIVDILRWPGVLQADISANEVLHKTCTELFSKTLEKLLQNRQREGVQIQQLLFQRIQQIENQLDRIKQRVPELLPMLRERLLQRLEELKKHIDTERLEQELVYFAQKIDVEEELDRFQIHISELKKIVEAGGAVGRRLDFLLQELQREINTLGVKSNDKIVTQQVVDIKVLLEQIREQVQNIE